MEISNMIAVNRGEQPGAHIVNKKYYSIKKENGA